MNEIGQRLNKDGTVSKIQGKPLFERWWVAKTAAERNQQIRRMEKKRSYAFNGARQVTAIQNA